jgi:serine/threonine protein kinase
MPFPKSSSASGDYIPRSGPQRIIYRRAYDQKRGRRVLIRELNHSIQFDTAARTAVTDGFKREVEIGARLRSDPPAASIENKRPIVEIYEPQSLEPEERCSKLIVEYVSDIWLNEALAKQGKLDEREALLIACDIAQAVEIHWERLIVHLGIRPSVVLLRRDGDDGLILGAKLDEYNLARISGDDPIIVNRTEVVEEYTSPQLKSGNARVDVEHDLYNIGLLLWEMLDGSRYTSLELKVRNPNKLEASPATKEIVSRALHTDPERRYKDPSELVADLKEALPEERDSPKTPSILKPSKSVQWLIWFGGSASSTVLLAVSIVLLIVSPIVYRNSIPPVPLILTIISALGNLLLLKRAIQSWEHRVATQPVFIQALLAASAAILLMRLYTPMLGVWLSFFVLFALTLIGVIVLFIDKQ